MFDIVITLRTEIFGRFRMGREIMCSVAKSNIQTESW